MKISSKVSPEQQFRAEIGGKNKENENWSLLKECHRHHRTNFDHEAVSES